MKIIRNARLLDDAQPTGRTADIVIDGEQIKAIESPGVVPAGRGEEIDASGFAVIPGLVNAHTHTHAVLGRGVGDKWTLESLLVAGAWTGGGRDLEIHRLSVQLAAAEMVAKGCTAVFDMFAEFPNPTAEGVQAVAQAYFDAGMRAVVAPMTADRTFYQVLPEIRTTMPGELADQVDRIRMADREVTLDQCRRIVQNWSLPTTRVRPGVAPTIPLHCSDEFLQGNARLAQEYGVCVQMHVAESPVQAVVGRERYGTTLCGHVERMGLLSSRFSVAHGVWLEAEDYERLADVGASIAHNPGSNLRLGSGIGAMRAWLDAGINVGVGTDGVTSSDNLNTFEAMRIATFVSRVRGEQGAERWIGAREAFDAATRGGAKLMGMDDITGTLAPGKAADLVFIDLGATHYLPLNNLLHQLVYAEDGTGVDSTMIAGEFVYRRRKHTRLDLAQLRRQAEAAAERWRERVAPIKATAERLEPYVGKYCWGIRARICGSGCAHTMAPLGGQ